jgi:hypothetical protein
MWTCHPLAVVLDPPLADPVCPGCRAVIDFEELPRWKEYKVAERIQYRLDLRLAELKVERARAEREKVRIENAA